MSSRMLRALRFQLSTLSLVVLSLILTGCGTGNPASPSVAGMQLQGSVHGGQQPVTGSSIQLYAAGTAGYGAGATSLLTAPVTTDSTGFFTITGDYACPSASSQLYIVASGGNPGLGTPTNNTALVMMAALGPCTLYGNTYTLNPAGFITINEVTTVAAAYALSGFMDPVTTQIGTSPTNAVGLANAFQTANNLVNITTGVALTLVPGSTSQVPQSQINGLANILSGCVNSSGSGTPCTTLFAAATPAGDATPTNTLQTMLSIAQHPYSPATALEALIPASPPFQPSYPQPVGLIEIYVQPSPGFVASAMALDPSGNAWFVYPGVGPGFLEFSPSGVPITPPAYQVNPTNPLTNISMAFDPAGNLWVTGVLNSSGYLYKLSPNSTSFSAFTNPNLTSPSSLAIDGNGNVWVTNSSTTNPALFKFANDGTLLSPTTGYTAASLTSAGGLAIDNFNNVWVAGTSIMNEFSNSGQLLQNYAWPGGPGPIAIDFLGNIWNGGPVKVSNTGTQLSVSPWCTIGFSTPPVCEQVTNAFALDGAGNAWGGVHYFYFFNNAGLQELNNSGAQLYGPGGNLNDEAPAQLAVDASGNLWAAPSIFPAPPYNLVQAIVEYVGASTPMSMQSIGTKNHTVGMRP
jgi:hypothetical protein